jgi:signal transduction histidine kinase
MLDKVTAGEVVREIIFSLRARTDVDQVLQVILNRVRDMFEAGEVYIMLVEGERLRLHAAEGLPEAALGRATLRPGEGIEGMAAELGETVAVPDAARHPRFIDPFSRQRPVGAMAVVPMVLRGRPTGIIAVTRPQQGQFAGSSLWWLDVLGALAGLAIEDDRAYRAQERRARQAEVLSEVNAQAGADESTLLPRLTSALAGAFGVSRVDVMLADQQQGALVSNGHGYGLRGAGLDAHVSRISLQEGGPLAQVYESGKPYLCNNAQNEPELRCQFADEPLGSLLAVPVNVSGERRGVLYLANEEPGTFTKDDEAFMSIVSARVGALLEGEELRRKRLQLQRVEAESQARHDFVGVVSHELKTPVAVIQAYTDLLFRRAEKAGGDANTDIVRRIAEQAERMLGLIEQVLDLQRIEAGLFRLEISRFDIVAMARQLVEMTQTTTQQHTITVDAAEPIIVSADRRRVEEVLQNLIDNAIKFSPNGGAVQLSIELSPRQNLPQAVVAVRDQGQGIDRADQPRVFERFYQGNNRLGRGHVGLGLGLYVSREIVSRHGGEMWLESSPGKGSVFYFSLPASGPEEE